MQSIVSSKTIARNVGIFGGAQAFSVLAALARTKVAAEFIGTAGVGLSALYGSSVIFFGNLCGLGLSFSGVKYLSEVFARGDRKELEVEVGRFRGLGVFCAIAGAVFSVVLSPLFSYIFYRDFSHIFPFAILSLFVVSTILSGIELAVLKSCQKTRQMAISLIWAAVVSVVISVPLYILKGIDGVLWAVLISGICESLLTYYFGNKTVRFAFRIENPFGGTASPLITLGLAFLAGSVIASGADLAIQSFFSIFASKSVLGLYKAGFQLSITYTGMIFTAVSSDFYPRLSAVCGLKAERNLLLSRQIKVLLLITTPLVSLFILLVPYLLPLLYNDTFNPMCRMVQIASLSIIVKSVTMPLNFLPLALGRSKDYLLLEGSFWLLMIPLVIGGYQFGGLDGAGVAIFICHLIELVYVFAFCKCRYAFSIAVGES